MNNTVIAAGFATCLVLIGCADSGNGGPEMKKATLSNLSQLSNPYG
mgnify:CR=1 FL=1